MKAQSNSWNNPRRSRLGIALVALMALVAIGVSAIGSASAQAADVVAEGLNGPQDVIVGPDGALWVIDAGVGGDEAVEFFNGEAGEVVTGGFGQTARVVRVDPSSGESTDVATLASLGTEEGGSGGGALAWHDGVLYAGVGEWVESEGLTRPDGFAAVWSVSEAGETAPVLDTFAYELANDPHPHGPPTSHPYGLLSGSDGKLWVVDAGANTLLSGDVATGELETVAVFEALPGAFPRPDYDGEMLTDAVPTAATVGADGTVYVSLLSGAPFIPGNAKVVSVGSDGTVGDYATGLTMLTDLVTGPDGNLYATQFAIFGEQGPDPTSGAVFRIGQGGAAEKVADGLSFPTAIAFADNGDAYVTVGGVGAPGSGQVLRLAALTDAAAIADTPAQLPTTGSSTALFAIVAVTMIAAGLMVVRSGAVRLRLG